MTANNKNTKKKDHYVRNVRKYRLKSIRSILKTTKKYH